MSERGKEMEKSFECDDAISRQAVLKIIDGWYEQNRDTENIEDLIVLITYMDSVRPQEQIPEQWQELKETIIEMRDNDGTGTQQEVCKFLANYMEVLEKQMVEPKPRGWKADTIILDEDVFMSIPYEQQERCYERRNRRSNRRGRQVHEGDRR